MCSLPQFTNHREKRGKKRKKGVSRGMENQKVGESVHVREEEDDVAVEEEEEQQGDVDVGSSMTLERVAAAKKFIENHYRSQRKHIQERKER